MADEEHFRRLERMYAAAPCNRYYEPVLRVGRGEAALTLGVQEKFFHAAHAVHGSVYFKALDDAAYFAASSLVRDVAVLTASFHLHMLRPVSNGELRASGRVAHRSARLLVAEATLVDADGHEVGRGSGTFMKSDIPLTPEIGYE